MTQVAGSRRLVVNADDFGQSPGVTEGILTAHEHGIVTSTSLMVRWPAAPDAVERARHHPALSIGLHVDLGEWQWVDGQWIVAYQVVDVDDAEAVRREVVSQFERFEALCGTFPTHIDSHQHVHMRKAKDIVLELAKRHAIPVRHFSKSVKYLGAFYGQTEKGGPLPDLVRVPSLVATLERLPSGITELGCHPSAREDLATTYSAERLVELATLCDPEVRAALVRSGIELINFGSLRNTA